mgnify:CR=1 FL=1
MSEFINRISLFGDNCYNSSSMNTRLTADWIKKVQEVLKEDIAAAEISNQAIWFKSNNLPNTRENQKKYIKTPKGKIARKRTECLRNRRHKKYIVAKHEKELIRIFYMECPADHHVDHIIPLAKGGSHTLANLQWLPKMINLKKNTKVLLKEGDFPQCLISVKNGQI